MDAIQQLVTELTSILSGKPTRLAFRALASLLETSPNLGHNDFHQLVRSSLDSWPDSVRHMDCKREQLQSLTCSPVWELIRSISLEEGLLLQFSLEQTSNITELETPITGDEFSPALFPNIRLLSATVTGGGNVETLEAFLLNKHSILGLEYQGHPQLPTNIWSPCVKFLQSAHSHRLENLRLVFPPIGLLTTAVDFKHPSLQQVAIFPCSESEWTAMETAFAHKHIKSIDFTSCEIGDDGLKQIGLAKNLHELEYLNLSDCALTPKGLEYLLSSPCVPVLKELKLNNNQLGDVGWEMLARANFRNLTCLELRETNGSAAGAAAIGRSRSFEGIEGLDISWNAIKDAGAHELVTGAMRSLKILRLDGNGLGEQGIMSIAVSDTFRSLEELSLSGSRMGISATKALALAAKDKLNCVVLNGCDLGDRGTVELVAGDWSALRTLLIENNGIGDSGMVALAKAPTLSNLWRLSLRNNPAVSSRGIEALATSNLQKLVELDVTMMETADVARVLAEAQILRRLDRIILGPSIEVMEPLVESTLLRSIAKGRLEYAIRERNAYGN